MLRAVPHRDGLPGAPDKEFARLARGGKPSGDAREQLRHTPSKAFLTGVKRPHGPIVSFEAAPTSAFIGVSVPVRNNAR